MRLPNGALTLRPLAAEGAKCEACRELERPATPDVIRSIPRAFVASLGSVWSKVPERERRLLRPLAWRIPGVARLRRLDRQVRSTKDVPRGSPFLRPGRASKRLAQLRVREALRGERTRGRLVLRVVRFAAREPGTLVRAASVADVAKLVRRLVTPSATSGSPAAQTYESPLEIEASAVAERFALPIEFRDVKPIELPYAEQPEVSFVIPVWNRWHFTYRCLAAIAENVKGLSYEVVVVDNGSSDETRQILDGVRNLRVVRNETNLGFLLASNQGAQEARGKYLLFLNNDAHILSGTVPAMLSMISSDPQVGVVGGRLIFLDGRLQEAGSIIWRDGSCLGYGRGNDPFEPQYSFARDVDFCSGALLLTPREVFLRLGMFDERYAPAYYEDADYCMSVRANGFRVVYQPAAAAVHHEYGSAPRREAAVDAQLKNRRLFVDKWDAALGSHLSPSPDNVLRARDATHRPSLLLVDDRVPDVRLGGGFPRTYRMLLSLRELDWAVTFLPLQAPGRVEPCTSELEACGIEVISGPADRKLDLEAFLESRPGHYDVIFVSRPHNMKEVQPFLRGSAPQARIVYDAEAIYAHRELRLLRLQGHDVDDNVAETMVRDEVSLVHSADAIVAASGLEARTFEKFGGPNAHVVGHHLEVRPTATPFKERVDLLFVGAVLVSPSPNEDAVLYFVREILPLVRRRLPCTLNVVGTNWSRTLSALKSEGVRIVGAVDDLAPWYSRSRVFVVPTRYAAGIPLKLYEASAFGLPSVATPLIAEQVGWTERHELLVGADPEAFARAIVELYSDEALWERVRAGALSAVTRECSKEAFVAGLRAATGRTVMPTAATSQRASVPPVIEAAATGTLAL
jgi:GT2 family glycosyltransferase/glycosyltransferase involved in cell wall biosynthesis